MSIEYYTLGKDKRTPEKIPEGQDKPLIPFKERLIKQTTMPDKKWVSTVFIGRDESEGEDQPPKLFGTKVFPKHGVWTEMYSWFYPTWDEAEKGHMQIVKWLHENKI